MAPVELQSLRLAIGAEGAANVGAFVVVKAEPAQGSSDALFGALVVARPIGVLDAQYESAAVTPRVGVVEEGGVGRTDMWIARRAGRDAHAWTSHLEEAQLHLGVLAHHLGIPRRAPDDVDAHVLDPRHLLAQRLLHLAADILVHWAGRRGEGHGYHHVIVLHLDAVDEAQIDQRQHQLWVVDCLERLHYLVFGDHKYLLSFLF